MGVLQIGPGYCYAKDANGMSVTVGMLEGGTLGPFSIEQKFANGQYQMDEYAANTGIKVEGKVEFKSLDLQLLQTLGLSQYAGAAAGLSDIPVIDGPFTAVASTLTVTGATAILGVRDAATGRVLKQVSGAPTGDQWKLASATTVTVPNATGAYLVTYMKAAATDTNKLNLVNAVVQESVYFGLTGIGVFSGKSVVYNFPRCVCKSLPLFEAKQDFAKREFDVKVLAVPDLHTIGSISLSEVLA
jgi:hypothetical protein